MWINFFGLIDFSVKRRPYTSNYAVLVNHTKAVRYLFPKYKQFTLNALGDSLNLHAFRNK